MGRRRDVSKHVGGRHEEAEQQMRDEEERRGRIEERID